jgi:hypothetical protein
VVAVVAAVVAAVGAAVGAAVVVVVVVGEWPSGQERTKKGKKGIIEFCRGNVAVV